MTYSKRIVADELSGIRRIVGTVDQLKIETKELPVEIQFDDGRIYSRTEVKTHYVRYKEKEPVCGPNLEPTPSN